MTNITVFRFSADRLPVAIILAVTLIDYIVFFNAGLAVSSYALILKNQHPESDETQALIEWERKQGGRK